MPGFSNVDIFFKCFTPVSTRRNPRTNAYLKKFMLKFCFVFVLAQPLSRQFWWGMFWMVIKVPTCPNYMFFTRQFQGNIPTVLAFNFPPGRHTLLKKYDCLGQQATLRRDFAHTSWKCVCVCLSVCVLSEFRIPGPAPMLPHYTQLTWKPGSKSRCPIGECWS